VNKRILTLLAVAFGLSLLVGCATGPLVNIKVDNPKSEKSRDND